MVIALIMERKNPLNRTKLTLHRSSCVKTQSPTLYVHRALKKWANGEEMQHEVRHTARQQRYDQ